MRILYLHPKSWSGELPILRKFVSLGHDVFVLEESRGAKGPSRWVTDHFDQIGDAITTMWYDPGRGLEKLLTWPLDRFFKKSFDGRNLAHRMLIIRAAVRRFSPDVVVASDGFSYAIPGALLRRLGALRQRFLVSYIGGDILDCPEAEVGKRRTFLTDWLIRFSVKAPDVLRPVSPLMKGRLLQDGADAARIRVIPSHLVISTQQADDVRSRRKLIAESIRRRHGLPCSAPLIVTLGGNQKGKGLQILIQAWTRVLSELPDAKWIICGPDSPWLVQKVKPEIIRLGIASSVVFAGKLEGADVFEYLAAADVHVNPSLCESLNMVTVEAASVGTPSICSDGAGICDWITRYGAGCVTGKGQVVELADAIISALLSSATREAWAAAGPMLAREFSLESISKSLLDCFQPVFLMK